MATPEQLEAKIAALKSAMDSGVLIVRHGDTSTQFRSWDEMTKALRRLEKELAAANGESPKPKVRYVVQTSKGYGAPCKNPFADWEDTDG